MAQASTSPLDLECPLRSIVRLLRQLNGISVNGYSVKCQSDCPMFLSVRHGATGRKVTKGCSVKVNAIMLNKQWMWE